MKLRKVFDSYDCCYSFLANVIIAFEYNTKNEILKNRCSFKTHVV